MAGLFGYLDLVLVTLLVFIRVDQRLHKAASVVAFVSGTAGLLLL